MLQHVTNPELCIECSACELACPQKAIAAMWGRYCIDYNLCTDCRKCIVECPTGAADCFIEVVNVYMLEEQASWSVLPSE